ncbi:MAG TPA: hypothetical protein VFO76_11720 [Candidatus Kapabacteria bacterium]|nr:hypothetical protein [Candidatus Kapabacteria bacterium]
MPTTNMKHESFNRTVTSFADIKALGLNETEPNSVSTKSETMPTHRTFDDGVEYRRYELSQESDTTTTASV